MEFTVKATVGTDPKPDFVGRNASFLVTFSVAENHNVNEGTKEEPNWVTKSTSWYQVQAWGDTAEEIMNDEIGQGDFLELKGFHKKNKVQKKNEKPVYYDVYTINEYEIIGRKRNS